METGTTDTGRGDRKLGDEWEDWSGSLDESTSYHETEALFTLFAAMALLVVMAGIWLVVFLIEPRLSQVHPVLVWTVRASAG